MTLPGFPEPGIEKRWTLFGEVPAIVDEKFEDGRGYAQDAFRIAQETIEKLTRLAAELSPIDVDVFVDEITPPDIGTFTGVPPVAPTIELNLPDDLDEVDDVNQAVHDKLLTDIQSGGPAIPQSVEDAIFGRETERAELVQNDNLDRISDEWAKRGFTLPDSVLAALIAQSEIDYKNKRLDLSRDVAIKSFELGDANTKFAIEKGIQWYALRIQTYQAKIQAEISRIDAIVKAYLGEVDVYKGIAAVFTTLADVEIKEFDAKLRAELARAELIIKDAEIDIKNYEMLNGLKIEAMKSIASVSAQLVAGALSSVSASANISASNSASYNYTPPALESVSQ